MKYPIENISSSEYLDLVNQESDPNTKLFKLNYYSIGSDVFVHLKSGMCSVISDKFDTTGKKDKDVDKFLEAETAKLQALYDGKKETNKEFGSLFGSAIL